MNNENALIEACRRRRILLREGRLAIVREIAAASDHPTIEQLHERVRVASPGVSLATVYRTLATLLRYGLIFKFDFGDGVARYEDASVGPHGHIIDASTGIVTNFSDPRIEKAIADVLAERGLASCGHRLEVVYVDSSKIIGGGQRFSASSGLTQSLDPRVAPSAWTY